MWIWWKPRQKLPATPGLGPSRSIGTEGLAGESGSLDRLPTPKSLLPEAFGTEWHPLAPNATSTQWGEEKVRPEGLEPPTLGSEDRCSIQLSYGRNCPCESGCRDSNPRPTD